MAVSNHCTLLTAHCTLNKVTIFEKIDGILATLEVPFYYLMPELARELPDLFITYNFYNKPSFFGDGDEISSRFFVTFGIFGKSNTQVNNLYETLKTLLKNSGFCRSGTLYTSDSNFPKYFRITADYNIDL